MLNNLPRLNIKDWIDKHAGHKKVCTETVLEEEFMPYGSRIATKSRVTVLKISECLDCRVAYIYDWLREEKDI